MKFEMNRYTLGMLLSVEGLVVTDHSLTEKKYTLLDIPVVVNTDESDGVVQLGNNRVDISSVIQDEEWVLRSLHSLLYTAKRRCEGLHVQDVDPKKLDKVPEHTCVKCCTGGFFKMSGETLRILKNHPEISRFDIDVNRIAGRPVSIDDSIETLVIEYTKGGCVKFNPYTPTLDMLKNELMRLIKNAK